MAQLRVWFTNFREYPLFYTVFQETCSTGKTGLRFCAPIIADAISSSETTTRNNICIPAGVDKLRKDKRWKSKRWKRISNERSRITAPLDVGLQKGLYFPKLRARVDGRGFSASRRVVGAGAGLRVGRLAVDWIR